MPQFSHFVVKDSEVAERLNDLLKIMRDLNPGILAPESMSTPRCGAASPSSPYTMFCDGKYEDTCSLLTEEHTLGDLKTIFFSSPRKAIQAPFPFPTLIFMFISRRNCTPGVGISLHTILQRFKIGQHGPPSLSGSTPGLCL